MLFHLPSRYNITLLILVFITFHLLFSAYSRCCWCCSRSCCCCWLCIIDAQNQCANKRDTRSHIHTREDEVHHPQALLRKAQIAYPPVTLLGSCCRCYATPGSSEIHLAVCLYRRRCDEGKGVLEKTSFASNVCCKRKKLYTRYLQCWVISFLLLLLFFFFQFALVVFRLGSESSHFFHWLISTQLEHFS